MITIDNPDQLLEWLTSHPVPPGNTPWWTEWKEEVVATFSRRHTVMLIEVLQHHFDTAECYAAQTILKIMELQVDLVGSGSSQFFQVRLLNGVMMSIHPNVVRSTRHGTPHTSNESET